MNSSKVLDSSLSSSVEQSQAGFPHVTALRKILAPLDIQINGQRPWDIQVHHPHFYKRVLSQYSVGLGESYMDGWWDCASIDELFYRASKGLMEGKLKIPLYFSPYWLKALLFNRQNSFRAFGNAQHHYDLSNEFYAAMLDKRLVYTCAYWKDAENIDEAQEAKLELVCQKLKLRAGMRVLDIGCGWGSFAKYAAQCYGVHVVGVTVSKKQAAYAQESCKGLAVEIRLQDYRDLRGQFDRIASLGMFEHVGQKNYRTYMQVVHRCLKNDGLFVLQTIGGNQSSLFFDPWMDKYIFPGAGIPGPKQVGEAMEGLFIMNEWTNTGEYYDRTLMSWFANFDRNWYRFKDKYGDKFYRMWKYYLLSCAGLFRSRKQQLWRLVLSKYPG